MLDWNVIVGVKPGGFLAAEAAMARFGAVERSDIVDILAVKVADADALVGQVEALIESEPGILDAIVGVVPLQHAFDFDGEEDFADNVGRVFRENWRPILKDKQFQIATRRRGYTSEVPRRADRGEKATDIVDELGMWGLGRDDCDYIVTIETLHRRAGMSIWSFLDFQRYEFLDLG